MGSVRSQAQLVEDGGGNYKGIQKQVKFRCGNANFAMLPLAVWLTCAQANTLIARVIAHNLPNQSEIELIREIKSVSPRKCEWRF